MVGAGNAVDKLDKEDCLPVIKLIEGRHGELYKQVRAALYWMQEPHRSILDGPKKNALRTFTAYWSAFECLVAAVTAFRPMTKRTKQGKQKAIDDLLDAWRPKDETIPTLDRERVTKLYQIVNPGLSVRTEYVFKVLFGDDAQVKKYMDQCFSRSDKLNRLYQVRNDISHGNIDASDLRELIRVEARVNELWLIVWGMFGMLVQLSTPADGDFHKPAD